MLAACHERKLLESWRSSGPAALRARTLRSSWRACSGRGLKHVGASARVSRPIRRGTCKAPCA